MIVVPRSPPAHQQDRHHDPDNDREQNALGVSSQRERDYQQRDADQEAGVPAGGLVNDPGLPHITHAKQDTGGARRGRNLPGGTRLMCCSRCVTLSYGWLVSDESPTR